jgi:hypothetical protein
MKALLVAPNTFVVRNWISSGLADELVAGLDTELVLLTPFAQESFTTPKGVVVRNVQAPTDPNDPMEAPLGTPKSVKVLQNLRHRLFALEVPDGSIQLMRMVRKKDVVGSLLRIAGPVVKPGGALRKLLQGAVFNFKPETPVISDIFDREKPDWVLVGSPGYFMIDVVAAIEAKRRNLPVHCVVNSWDNLSSRGPLFRRPDSLMVWNEYMKGQAASIHHYHAEHTHVVGPLQFVPYATPVNEAESREAYRRLELPEGTPYLLFLTGQHGAEYEAEDVAALAKALDDAGLDIKIAVRPHPQVPREPFKAIKNPRIVFDKSPVFATKGSGGADFGISEIRSMAALLHNASAVVASWATTGLLEAAIFDKPAIQLRWMNAIPRSKPDQAEKMKDLARYVHLQAFDACGSREFSDNPETVAAQIKGMLENPERGKQGRLKAAETLANAPLGGAPKKIVAVLRDYLCPGA